LYGNYKRSIFVLTEGDTADHHTHNTATMTNDQKLYLAIQTVGFDVFKALIESGKSESEVKEMMLTEEVQKAMIGRINLIKSAI
jgi:hypothetical protein